MSARSAAFTSQLPGSDLVRIASEQDVDLLLMEAPDALLDDPVVQAVLAAAPCDVGILAPREAARRDGPVLVPFAGDGARLVSGRDRRLDRAEPRCPSAARRDRFEEGRDASRLLARASLAVQRALGVEAEPALVAPGAEGLISVAGEAALAVVGLPGGWRRDGLGTVRHTLVRKADPPVLIVRRGLRPGGLTPPEGLTRFTWSIAVR